jgi:hypothetical protein
VTACARCEMIPQVIQSKSPSESLAVYIASVRWFVKVPGARSLGHYFR